MNTSHWQFFFSQLKGVLCCYCSIMGKKLPLSEEWEIKLLFVHFEVALLCASHQAISLVQVKN